MATRHSPSNDYAQFTQPTQTPTPETPAPSPGHGHGWLMWLMCVPMLVVIGMLIAAGGLGAGGLLYPLGCLAMMGAMNAVDEPRKQGKPILTDPHDPTLP